MKYDDFLREKTIIDKFNGFEHYKEPNEHLFDFQKDCVNWALKKGRCALCQAPGMGKTIQQLEWSDKCIKETNRPALILAPIAVSKQTKREGNKFGYDVNICSIQSDIRQDMINITNYEKVHKFDLCDFNSIVCDESSIFKGGINSKTRTSIFEKISKIPYRLFCSATPSPNNFIEIGEHSEGLGVLKAKEMLSMFFKHDGANTSEWVLKAHAKNKPFWEWLASWMVLMKKPSDLDYDDNGFILPALSIKPIIFKSDVNFEGTGFFNKRKLTLNERRKARRSSISKKVDLVNQIIKDNELENESVLCWVDLNDESVSVSKGCDFLEVTGNMPEEKKEELMLSFSDGKVKKLVTKPQIAGFGMNWQVCHNQIFFGLSDSWERFYQSIRRSWRFGQKKPVNVYIVISDVEKVVLDNIMKKEEQAEYMYNNMINSMKDSLKFQLSLRHESNKIYNPKTIMQLPDWLR